MAVLCMASVKGGSGKTVLSATFAAVLAGIDKRVLLVDTDAATNGLSLLYLDEIMAERQEPDEDRAPVVGAFELPGHGANPYRFVDLPTGACLMPATVRFANTEDAPPHEYRDHLERHVAHWRKTFDYVILDAQAGSDIYARISMQLADRVVIVSEYDPLSAAGVERLKALFPAELSFERTWVLLNKMLPDLVSNYSEFMEVARYLRPIPWNASVVRAYSRRSLALDLKYGNEYTAAVLGTIRPLLDARDDELMSAWIGARAAEIRHPISVRARDLRTELTGLRALREREVGASRMRSFALGVAIAATLTGVAATLWSTIGLSGVATLFPIPFLLVLLYERQRASHYQDGSSPQELELRHELRRLTALAELDDEKLLSRGATRVARASSLLIDE